MEIKFTGYVQKISKPQAGDRVTFQLDFPAPEAIKELSGIWGDDSELLTITVKR